MGLVFSITGVSKVGFERGRYKGEDTTFSKIGIFLVSIAPLNATRFLNFTLLNSAISDSLLCFGDVNGGKEIKRERTRG